MAVKVTITVEITTSHTGGDSSTQTLTEFRDLPTQPADQFAATMVEHNIADAGAGITRKVAALCGDIREDRPDAPGLRPTLRARPLTGDPISR